jgi:hypothetical protein
MADFDPSTAVATDSPQVDTFDPSSAKPMSDSLAEDATKQLGAYHSGQIDLSPETYNALSKVAANGQSPAQQAGGAISATAQGIGELGKQLLHPVEAYGKAKQAVESFGEKFGKEYAGAPYNGEATTQLLKDFGTGAITGISSLATSGIGLAHKVNRLSEAIFMPEALQQKEAELTDPIAGKIQHESSVANQQLAQNVGANLESTGAQAGQLAGQAIVPIGGEIGGAKTAATLGEALVEGGTKAAGVAMQAVGKTGKVVAPAAISAELALHGHPLLAAGELVAGYGPEGGGGVYGIARGINHAVVDTTFGNMNELGKLLVDSPMGEPLLQSAQNSVQQHIGTLQSDLDYFKKLNPKAAEEASTVSIENLSGPAKKIGDIQSKIDKLNGRSDMLGRFIDTNKVLSSAAKYAATTGVNVAGAGAIGGAISYGGTAPGDTESVKKGAESTAALGAIGAPFAAASGIKELRAEQGRTALIERGAKAIDPASLEGLPPEAQHYVTTLAGAADAMGKKIVVLSPEELLAKIKTNEIASEPQKPTVIGPKDQVISELPQEQSSLVESSSQSSMPPTVTQAPNGLTLGDTLYLNRDALGSGVGGHELAHATQQFFGQSLRESDPALMQKFEDAYAERLGKTGDFEFSPQAERDAEVGRILLQQTPLEMFYGGEQGGDVIKRIANKVLSNFLPEKTKVDQTLQAPYTKSDLQSMRERMFKVGEEAAKSPAQAQGSSVARPNVAQEGSATTTAPNKASAPTAPQAAQTGPEGATLPSDVVKALKKQGFSDEQIASIGPESLRGPEGKLSQATIPQNEGLQKAAVTPEVPKERLQVAVRLKDGRIIKGTSHGFVYDEINRSGLSLAGAEEGFVTPRGEFLYRDEAFRKYGGSTIEDLKPNKESQIEESDKELLRQLQVPTKGLQDANITPQTETVPQEPAQATPKRGVEGVVPQSDEVQADTNKTLSPIQNIAVRTPDGEIFTGKTHFEALDKAFEKYASDKARSDQIAKWYNDGKIEDGFLAQNGEYLDRVAALKRVNDVGQLNTKDILNPDFEGGASAAASGILEAREFNQNAKIVPDYEAIRTSAEAAKREELSDTNRKTKEQEISRAGLDAMAKEHAKVVGPDSDLVTFRTSKFGRDSISGKRIDPNDPFHQHLLEQANLSQADIGKLNSLEANMGKAVAVDYLHAPEESEASGVTRKGEQAESTAPERVAGEKATRRLSKSFVPTNITYNAPSKTFEVNGFSPDKFLNNVSQLIPWAKAKGLKGWDSVNDPLLVQDVNNLQILHKNGYTMNGKPIEGTPLTNIKPNPDFDPTPYIIPKDRADLLNAAIGNRGAEVGVRKASPEKADKQILAQQNSPFWEPTTGETNRVRSMLGEESKLLEPTSETLRPELIENVRQGNVEDKSTIRPSGFTGDRGDFTQEGTPSQHLAGAGFQPHTDLPEVPDKFREIATGFGLIYNGTMQSDKKKLYLFSDPQTGSTFSVSGNGGNEQLREKLMQTRARFDKKQ